MRTFYVAANDGTRLAATPSTTLSRSESTGAWTFDPWWPVRATFFLAYSVADDGVNQASVQVIKEGERAEEGLGD